MRVRLRFLSVRTIDLPRQAELINHDTVEACPECTLKRHSHGALFSKCQEDPFIFLEILDHARRPCSFDDTSEIEAQGWVMNQLLTNDPKTALAAVRSASPRTM